MAEDVLPVARFTHQNAKKITAFNGELMKILESLFSLISDLPAQFGSPFSPETCPPEFAEKFKSAFLGGNTAKGSANVVQVCRRLINLWMRLERIDLFDLREDCGDSIDYFGTLNVCAEEDEGLAIIEAMFEKMPNATDRLIARYLLASVAKTGADLIRKLILERGDASLRQSLTRSYQTAFITLEQRYDIIFSEEKRALIFDLSEFHECRESVIKCPYDNLLVFDRRSVAFTLFLLPLYMAKQGFKGAERTLTSDLEANSQISLVDLCVRFSRKRKKNAQLEESQGPNGLFDHTSAIDDKGLPKTPLYHLVEFVTTLPAKTATNLVHLVSTSVQSVACLYQSTTQLCASVQVLRAFADMRASLLFHIDNSSCQAAEKDLLVPHHACNGLCASVLIKTWDSPASVMSVDQFSERIVTRMKREAFFAIARTVHSLTLFIGQLFTPNDFGVTKKPGSFEGFSFVTGSLLAHLYLLLYSTSGERPCIKVLIHKVHITLASSLQTVRSGSAITPLSDVAPKSSFEKALVVAIRIVIRFSYILRLQPEVSNELIRFGTLPADNLLNCTAECAGKALKRALELRMQTTGNSHSPDDRATMITRSVMLRKRVALNVTLAMHLIANSSNYGSGILRRCSAAIAKSLTEIQNNLKSMLASVEKLIKVSDPGEVEEWSNMSCALSDADIIITLVRRQLGKFLRSLKSLDTGGSTAARNRKEIELRCFQKSMSNFFQKWDPFWRFFFADLLSELPSGVAEWLEGVESLRPPHFYCDTESKICHLTGIVLALSKRSFPDEPTSSLTLQRPSGCTPLWASAEAESRMIKETTNVVAASSCSVEVLDVLKFHANWLVRLGIQILVRKRTLDALGGTLFTSAWTTACLGQIEAELKSVGAECAGDFSRFADLYRHSLDNSVELAEFSDLGWTVTPMLSGKSHGALTKAGKSPPVRKHAQGVLSSVPVPSSVASGVEPAKRSTRSTNEAATSCGETSTPCLTKTGSHDEGIIELSAIPLPPESGKRRLSSPEMDVVAQKRGKSEKVDTTEQQLRHVEDLEHAANQLKNRLKAEFCDPDFLAKFFSGPSNSSDDILNRVKGVHYFAKNPNFFEKSASKFASRALLLENERMSLKRVLDQKKSTPEVEAMKLENDQLSRRLTILRDLLGGQRMNITDYLASDLERTVSDLQPVLNNLRRSSDKSTLVVPTFKALACEVIKTVFARILPHDQVHWTPNSGFWDIVRNLKILGEAFLSRKADVERISEFLPRIEQIVADKDARIAELESHLCV